MFKNILPNTEDTKLALPGDDVIKNPSAVIDSAFDLPGLPETVFPWFKQLGKNRAGWYLPRKVEFFIPKSRRATRRIEDKWQNLKVGQRIPDYGGKNGHLDCFYLENNKAIGYTSELGKIKITWVLSFTTVSNNTHVVIRLRIKTKKDHESLFMRLGKVFDRLTIAGLAAGLKERLEES